MNVLKNAGTNELQRRAVTLVQVTSVIKYLSYNSG